MTMPSLADLIYRGEVDLAVALANQLNPQEIHTRLFLDDDRHLNDEAACDVFLQRWFSQIKNPYLRADAADCFVGTYTTELAPVPNAEYIGAYMRTDSLRKLIDEIASAILGVKLRDLEETPEHPLDAATAEKWRAIGRILADLDLPPAVSPIAPEE